MFYYKIKKNNALIQYKEDAIPKNIKSIDYLEFEIANHDYTLNKYHTDNLLKDFIKEDNYDELLHKLNEATEYLSYKTLEEIYNEIDNKDEVQEWPTLVKFIHGEIHISDLTHMET